MKRYAVSKLVTQVVRQHFRVLAESAEEACQKVADETDSVNVDFDDEELVETVSEEPPVCESE